MKSFYAALAAALALMAGPAHAATDVLDFDDLARAGAGRQLIRENNFKYQGFNFRSVYVSDPNFFTLGLDDPANADPDGTTFGHTWTGYETHITRVDGAAFDVFSVDIADILNIGARHSGRFRFTFADNSQKSFDFLTDGRAGLQTEIFDMKNVTGMLYYADVGENVQIDNIRLTGSAAVPEPATWAMMILGLGGVGAALRNRRRVALA